MILFPQLPHAVALALVAERRCLDVRGAASEASFDHPDVVFTPTGGSRASAADIKELRSRLLSAAALGGYPSAGSEEARAAFDAAAAKILHSSMGIDPSEAAKPGVWEFVSCVLTCDLVRWRFPGEDDGTPSERFLSGRRNTFQRLWWRAFILNEEGAKKPYELLSLLGEDEQVQILERPYLAGSRALSVTVARELLLASQRHPTQSRRLLVRETQKHLRRLAAFASFDTVAIDDLKLLVRGIFDQVAGAESGKRRDRA